MSEFNTENKQIVFVDIVGYSLRTCAVQYRVIIQFMKDLNDALNKTVSKYKEHGLKKESIVTLPSGDGAAIAFPFQEQHSGKVPPYFLLFIQQLFITIYENSLNTGVTSCQEFKMYNYCNCHESSYCLRYGVSIGELVAYRDLNGLKNYAGTPINMAARVMNIAKNPNQVAITEEAYQYLKKFYTHLSQPVIFREYKNVKIKHNINMNIYQYIDNNFNNIGLNSIDLDIDKKHQIETLGGNSNIKKNTNQRKINRLPRLT